jgi:hypothetical protein
LEFDCWSRGLANFLLSSSKTKIPSWHLKIHTFIWKFLSQKGHN